MNEELQKAIADMFNSVLSAKDFLVGELPEYIEQLLMWKVVESFCYMLTAFAVAALWMFAMRYQSKVIKDYGGLNEAFSLRSEIDIPLFLANLVGHPVALICFCVFFNMEWLQIWIAPKVWLVEYAASLVK